MHSPITTAANRPMLEAPLTADTALLCGSCLETLTPNGTCLSVGSCLEADAAASVGASRTTLKAPMAWTIAGRVD